MEKIGLFNQLKFNNSNKVDADKTSIKETLVSNNSLSVNPTSLRANIVPFLGSETLNPKLDDRKARELLKDYQDNGSQESLSELYNGYQNYLKWIANIYVGLGLDKEDLLQEATVGFMKAINSADVDKPDSNFSTYVYKCAKNNILLALRTQNGDNGFTDKLRGKYNRAKSQLEQQKGIEPTHQEILKEIGILQEEYNNILGPLKNKILVSLDANISDDDESSLSEKVADKSQCVEASVVENAEKEELVNVFNKTLKNTELQAISLFTFDALSIDQISKKMQITKDDAVSNIVSAYSQLLKNDDFVELKTDEELKNINNIVKKYEIQNYLKLTSFILPESFDFISAIKVKTSKEPTLQTIQDEMIDLLSKMNLSAKEKDIVSFIFVNKPDTQQKIADNFGIPKQRLSEFMNNIKKKSKKAVADEYKININKQKDTTLPEILLFVNDLELLKEKTIELNKDKNNPVFTNIIKNLEDIFFDKNGQLITKKQDLSERMGISFKSFGYYSQKMLDDFSSVFNASNELRVEFPTIDNVASSKNLNKYLCFLTEQQKKVLIYSVNGYSYAQIGKELGVGKPTVVNVKKSALDSVEKSFPHSFEEFKIVVENPQLIDDDIKSSLLDSIRQ